MKKAFGEVSLTTVFVISRLSIHIFFFVFIMVIKDQLVLFQFQGFEQFFPLLC